MPVGSKILIYSNDTATREKLIQVLMYQKFIPKAVENVSYANLALTSGLYPIFLCDYTQEDQAVFDFLKIARQDKVMRSVTPIVIVNNPTRETLEGLVKIGCTNFVLQSEDHKALLDKVEAIAESLGDERARRLFAHIEIPEYENFKLLLTARNGNKYPVLISNISLGDLQLAWSPEKVPVQKMNKDDILTNCLLVAKNLDLYVDLKITSIQNYKATAQFVEMNEERKAKLCSFVYERLIAESNPRK